MQEADELVAGGKGAQWHAEGPDAGGRQPRHHEVGRVRVEEADPGARPGPGGQQGPRQLGGALLSVRVGEGGIVHRQQHAARLGGGAGLEQRADGEGETVARLDHGRAHHDPRRGETGGRADRSAATAAASTSHSTRSSWRRRPTEWMRSSVTDRSISKRSAVRSGTGRR
jgi:hypothetical protein